MAEQDEYQKLWAKIVTKAWADEDYKQQLLADPASVMKEAGVEMADDIELKCVEATKNQAWLVLPPKPEKQILKDSELDSVSGGLALNSLLQYLLHGNGNMAM